MAEVKKYLPIPFSAVLFLIVVWQIKPPEALIQASLLQLVLFFLPIFFFFVFLTNLYFKFFLKSILVSLAIIVILVLKALNGLNLLSLAFIPLSLTLIIKVIPSPTKKTRFNRPQAVENPPSLLKTIPKAKPPKISRMERKLAVKPRLRRVSLSNGSASSSLQQKSENEIKTKKSLKISRLQNNQE